MYFCIKGFTIPMSDDDGGTLDEQDYVVEQNSTWNLSEEKYRHVGGEIKLEWEKEWIEITQERFEECFVKVIDIINDIQKEWDNIDIGCAIGTLSSESEFIPLVVVIKMNGSKIKLKAYEDEIEINVTDTDKIVSYFESMYLNGYIFTKK